MLKNEIATCCKRLRLSRNLVDNSEMVQGESFQEYLLELLKLEIRHRVSRDTQIPALRGHPLSRRCTHSLTTVQV